MTTWVNIPDSVIEPAKPIRAIDARALRDNPIAIAEGAAGAPKVETGGIANRNLIGLHAARIEDAAFPVLTVSASNDTFLGRASSVTPGTTITNSASFVVARTITILKAAGSARFIASHRIVDPEAAGSSFIRLLKNGSVIGDFSTNNLFGVQRQVDSSIDVGDVFVWEHRISGPNLSEIFNIEERATDGYTGINLIIAVSDL